MIEKELYYRRQQHIKEIIKLSCDNEKGEEEKIKSIQSIVMRYFYYSLATKESHTDYKKLKKIMNEKEMEMETNELHDILNNSLDAIDILYSVILDDDVDEKLKKDYDKLANSFFEKLDEICCYVLRNWKII